MTILLIMLLFFPNEQETINKTNGVWLINENSKCNLVWTNAFHFDGEFVTVALFTEKEWMWRSSDEYYKLKTEWRENDLFYLPPFGKMTYLVV